ncbi:hypothetical protein PFICI_05604 [Pestalotiopsis fici W106-1]|uniref:Extracellular membrane protein CFEM domain-containing protein n=1 Tax=Pestalotiopsis fici (strain W106-1 / CGMCC3.15140) TaxID=1229662 RepID=W3XCD2_PESFW|nr:uncharacterized protein PFICI_05604 [Pestalotiopsis fici W106-1]ETS83728.1 hypothetical protein PFICI_05604 [Pestalotiopsis fici W106-1]
MAKVRSILLSACAAGLATAAQVPTLPLKAPDRAQITAAPVLNKAVVNAAVVNAAAASDDDSNYYGCENAGYLVEYCYDAYDYDACLCCDGSSYDPTYLDDSAKSCASYIEESLPASTYEYTFYSSLGSYCKSVGSDVCSITSAATYTSVATAPDACWSVVDIADNCAYTNSGIYEDSDEEQASCFCYTTHGRSTTWAPDVFDGEASECADWAATAETEYYSDWLALATFCQSVGDIMTTSTSGTKTSSTPPAAQTGHSGTTTSATATSTSASATAVTVTVAPSATGTSAANTMSGGASIAFGLASVVVALFAYAL